MDIERFRMIDEVVAVSHDLSAITCVAVVPTESRLFEGHFPGNPLLPGALSIELMAQASGFLGMLNTDVTKMGYLLAVENARFRAAILPGTRLVIRARMTHLGSGYGAFECSLEAAGSCVASANIRIKLSDFANDVLRDSVLDLLRRLHLRERVEVAAAQP
jgi:3-hydroxyacyl-[acyl-carrier-protein] dehydratase